MDRNAEVENIIKLVWEALSVQGYSPINQLIGYIISGDPTYITSYLGARVAIMKVERDELLECFITNYIEQLKLEENNHVKR